MSYYITCPNCGAHLDPGEHCECESWSDTRKEILKTNIELPDEALDYVIARLEEGLNAKIRKGA